MLPVRAARAAALLCPANLAPLAHPRTVIVIHDAAALRHPEWYSPAYAAWQRRILPALARRALHVVTVSEFSRGELIDLLQIPPERITVVAGGVDAAFTPHADADRRARRSASPAPTSSASPPRPRARTCRRSSRSPPTSTSSSPAATARSSRARRGWTHCGTSARSPTRCSPACTRAPRRSRCRASTRASACPCSRRWRAGRPSSSPTTARSRRPRARRAASSPADEVPAASARCSRDDQERERLRAAGLQRAAGFTWDRTAREIDALLSERIAAPRA